MAKGQPFGTLTKTNVRTPILSWPKDPELKGDHLLAPLLKMDQNRKTKRSKGRLWTTDNRLNGWFKKKQLGSTQFPQACTGSMGGGLDGATASQVPGDL